MNTISIIILAIVCIAFFLSVRQIRRSGGKKSCCKDCDGRCSCC